MILALLYLILRFIKIIIDYFYVKYHLRQKEKAAEAAFVSLFDVFYDRSQRSYILQIGWYDDLGCLTVSHLLGSFHGSD